MSYPDWLVNTLIQFNHRVTCLNEWELMNIAVDFQRNPDLPERLKVLFRSLQDGFGKEVLITGNFLALGYYDEPTGNQVFPKFLDFTGEYSKLLEVDNMEDDEATVEAYKKVLKYMRSVGRKNEHHLLIIQLPYFVKKVTSYAPGTDFEQDISFCEFQKLFDAKKVLFTGFEKIRSEEDVQRWFREHRANLYEQRFIFTLGFFINNGIEDTILDGKYQEVLSYFIGSFLSWSGMGVADATRYMMAAAAAKLAHYSHEFLKPFADLREFANQNAASIPSQLRPLLDRVLAQARLLDLSSITFRSEAGFSFKTLLKESFLRDTDFSRTMDLQDGTQELTLMIEDVRGKTIQIAFEHLPDDSVIIQFDPLYFYRLMRNLLRNAAQNTLPDGLVRICILVEVDENNGFLTMDFKHMGSKIPREIRRKLFRMPIPSDNSSRKGGIGLWTVGMAFEALRLPRPEIIQEADDVCFIFHFPLKKGARGG